MDPMGRSRSASPSRRLTVSSLISFRFRRHRIHPPTFVLALVLCTAAYILFHPRSDPALTPASSLTTLSSGYDRSWSPAALWARQPDPLIARGLEHDAGGLLRGWDGLLRFDAESRLSRRDKARLKGLRERHPIEELVSSGLERWTGLLARQSKTLDQAVREYSRRYGRAPPKGFDKWWEFCQRHGVKIVDDYDQINRDIEPYFALSPAMFQQRVKELSETAFSYQIDLCPTSQSTISGERGNASRPKSLFSLLEPIAQYLPTDVEIHGSDHDMGSWLLGDDQKQAALSAAKEGRYLTQDELKAFEKRAGRVEVDGLVSACPEDSPAWKMRMAEKDGLSLDVDPSEPSFVYDPAPGYDFCYTPENLRLHGALSFDFTRETILRPIFQLSKFARNPEFLTTPLQAYENVTSEAARKKTMKWEDKTVDKLFWRGSSTGDSYAKKKNGDWRRSHRPRLHLMAQNGQGSDEVYVQRGRQWERESWEKGKLNEVYLDVGLTGKPHQCKKDDGTCDEMEAEIVFKDRVAPEQSSRYKYVLDVDGNGWSSRFNRLIMSGSVVVKSTIYPEWNSDWLTPWVHYVPIQIDYSDVYNIMSFFVGSPDRRTDGHDDVAKGIAERARSFGLDHWRWEDMQAYMFRLLLEYARLMADDRERWIYDPGLT